MAKTEHLRKLREGKERWNAWRTENRQTIPDLRSAPLSGWNLQDFDLRDVWLTKADLRNADLFSANLARANLVGANLSAAYLYRANLLLARLNNATASDAYLSGAFLLQADLSGADFTGADLSGAMLNQVRAEKTIFVRANLGGTSLWAAHLKQADLSEAFLYGAVLVNANLEGAKLNGCRVYGLSIWDAKLTDASQSDLIITPPDQPTIQVDNLEIAQFIYLLLSRHKLRQIITTIGEKAVLILGRFSERKELLDLMADKLRSLGYIPMIFDFERPTDRDLSETVRILAGISRFVIADITNPRSVPLELQATIPDYMVPFVTILQRGQPAFSMFDDLPRKYHWALPLLEYNTAETLLSTFEQKVITPALEKVDEVRRAKAAPALRRSAED
jgi:Pentapeptide repeats (8 copies)